MEKHEWKRYGMTLILSGPSGSGKSSIYKKAFEQITGFEFSVSCTTRQPRPGEVDGVDYHFISKEAFEEKIQQNEFVEYAQVHGNYYGTLKSELYQRMQQGIDVLLDIDVQGAMQIRKACEMDQVLKNACEFVFLSPPSPEELERRLRNRGTETEEVIQRRLSNAKWEMEQWQHYDYLLINHDLTDAVNEFIAMIRTFRNQSKRLSKGNSK